MYRYNIGEIQGLVADPAGVDFLRKEMFDTIEKEKATCEGHHSLYAKALVEFMIRFDVSEKEIQRREGERENTLGK